MQIKLLATDLDGTLLGGSGELFLFSDFRERLKTIRKKYNAKWVVCTGRSLRSFLHAFSPMIEMGMLPDYLIIHRSYIYKRKGKSYHRHYRWNFLIHYHIWASRLQIKEAFQKWHRLVNSMTDGMTTVHNRKNRLCMQFKTEEDALAVSKLLEEKARELKYIHVLHYLKEVDIRVVPFTKGLALEELANHIGIGASSILAIGNGRTDISMLNGVTAKLVGCPGNADPDVMAAVNKSKGHIASRKLLGGVIDNIDAFVGNKINSDLPEWWVPNNKSKSHQSTKRQLNNPPNAKNLNTRKVSSIIIIIAIVYCVALAFANFGVIPLSGLIRKPVLIVMDLIVKFIEFF